MIIEKNFNLTRYNSYRIQSKCQEAYFPESESDIIKFFEENIGSPYVLIGSGHNIVLTHEYYKCKFIIISDTFSSIAYNSLSLEITASSGCSMKDLSNFAANKALTGLEMFVDIPSSLGGAIVMNAGASGEEIKDVIVEVKYLDTTDMQVKHIHVEDINFEYRNGLFQKNKGLIVLSSRIKLIEGNEKRIWEKMQSITMKRWNKQPRDYPNAGSVFKRPKGFYVGALIEELGLKGHQIGGAKVSEKHAGFIINYCGATGRDIVALIELIKQKVMDNYGIDLEIEQRVI